jgi:phospho-N-acetylmuramoyl-pentapeptide-transferase
VLVAALVWCRLDSAFIVIPLAAGLMSGAVGLADDLKKIRGGSSDTGVSRGTKYAVQIAIGAAVAGLLFWEAASPLQHSAVRHSLYLPFLREGLYLGAFYTIIVAGFFVAASNAVNLTDGMDGLAIVPTVLVAVVLGAFAYITGRADYAEYLYYFPVEVSPDEIEYGLRGAGELTVLCSAVMGAGVGFLWFNAHPASLFMGDTGSMALGGLLGSVAILSKQEAIFFIAGGLFLLEVASSFIQDYIGLRILGRRIFFRAPLHHNMLHKGVAETKVTVRLWIIAAFFAVIALCTLKLR